MRRLDGSEYEPRHLIAIFIGAALLACAIVGALGCSYPPTNPNTEEPSADKVSFIAPPRERMVSTDMGSGVTRLVDCKLRIVCYRAGYDLHRKGGMACVRVSVIDEDWEGVCP